MKIFIKTKGNRITNIRHKMIEGFTEVEVSDGLRDIQLINEYVYENGQVKKSELMINKRNLQEEYYEIMGWLRENDWKVNKVVLSEWEPTDSRWVEYKEQRAVKRARLDKIKEALGI